MIDAELTETALLLPTSVVVTAKEQLSCDLGGEEVILDLKSGVYFGLDAIGADIWKLIQTPVSVSELEDRIMAEYDVGRDQCHSDVTRFLVALIEHGLVEITN